MIVYQNFGVGIIKNFLVKIFLYVFMVPGKIASLGDDMRGF